MPRVLVCGGLQLSQSLWAIHRGFERAGCECAYLQTTELSEPDSMWAGRKRFNPALTDGLLSAALESDLLFWWQPQNDVPIDVLQNIKRNQPHLPLVMQTIDDPQMWDFLNPERIAVFDYAVTCCEDTPPLYEKYGVEAIVGYPPCDRDLHGNAKPADGCADIAFVATNTYNASLHPEVLVDRIEIIRRLLPLGNVRVYGLWNNSHIDWSRLGDELKDRVYGGHKNYHTELPGIYVGTRINLTSHFRPNSRNPFNERTISCIASGGFTLCDRIGGIEDIFTDGEHLALWGDLDELVEKATWYLAHEEERAKVAKAGQAKCLELFNNERLARTILAIALGEKETM